MNQPLKILFKFPCRGRKEIFFSSIKSLTDNIRDINNYHISFTLDTDDEVLNNKEVIEELDKIPNSSVQWGLSKSKINAVNRDIPDIDYDILIVWSNDMFATFYGFDDVFREYIYHAQNKQGDDDFLVHFPEPDSNHVLNVLYIATKKYIQRFGYIYHPSYKSLWCDNESLEVAKMLNRYHYFCIPGLYEHRNPAYHKYGIERDDMFNEQQSHWIEDENNFKERKKRNFDLLNL